MLQLTPQSRILLATEPVDFRKGIDGLAAVCCQVLGDNPLSGALYVFRNRSGTALKILESVHRSLICKEDMVYDISVVQTLSCIFSSRVMRRLHVPQFSHNTSRTLSLSQMPIIFHVKPHSEEE